MRFSGRYVPTVLFTFLSLTLSLYAQSTTRQTNKAPGGSVSGRITIKEKGAAGIVVGLRKTDSVTPIEPWTKATTDHDGFYRIPNVAPGSYEVTFSAPAFVIPGANPTSKSKSVIVGEDDNVEGINFSLVRGGVITGKVTDADSRPVIQQQVFLYRTDAFEEQGQQQQRQVLATTSVQTDDRGIYRIYGISAGRYKVGVGRSDTTFTGMVSPNRASYRQVFHPDVTDQTKATVIEVSEGSESSGVDITLGRALQVFSASGRIVDGENGSPMPNIRFGVQRHTAQRVEFVSSMAMSNVQGDFILEGLPPGKYGFYLFPNQNLDARVDALTFDITDQDVSGLTITLTKGASISGVVALETEDKTALGKLTQMQLRAFVSVAGGGGGMGQTATSPIAPDGSFRLGGLPGGAVNIMLSMAFMQPKGFMLSRIERDGVVLPRTLEIKDGEQVTGVRIVFAYGTATLRGVVKLENGSLPEGVRIVVRLKKQGDTQAMIQPSPVDARGHFVIEGLPPGNYELTAMLVGTGRVVPANRATREVVVQDGAPTEVMIILDLGTPPKP